MKKSILTAILLSFIVVYANGQTDKRHFSYTAYAGTGISMSQPSRTPFTGQLIAHYHINQRFAIGAGSGLSVYEKLLIHHSPSVGAQFRISRKLKMNFALGYEFQELERLKKYTDQYFHTEFKEELSHHSITLKIGLTY